MLHQFRKVQRDVDNHKVTIITAFPLTPYQENPFNHEIFIESILHSRYDTQGDSNGQNSFLWIFIPENKIDE